MHASGWPTRNSATKVLYLHSTIHCLGSDFVLGITSNPTHQSQMRKKRHRMIEGMNESNLTRLTLLANNGRPGGWRGERRSAGGKGKGGGGRELHSFRISLARNNAMVGGCAAHAAAASSLDRSTASRQSTRQVVNRH